MPSWIRAKAWLVGAACFAAAMLLRMLLEGYTSAAYITFYPAVSAAFLLAGWRSGVACLLASVIAGWFLFVPTRNSFWIETPQSLISVLFFVVSCILILYLAQRMERAMTLLKAERDRSGLLFEELQHRVANNMMLVSSVLDMHRRDLPPTERVATSALQDASQRIQAFGRLHRRLHDSSTIDIPVTDVLAEMASDLLEASGRGDIVCEVFRTTHRLDLDQLTAVALIANEALTNSIKYGFGDRNAGAINVSFRRQMSQYELRIMDDGVGAAGRTAVSTGVGTRVMQGLAAQLGGTLTVELSASGALVSLLFPSKTQPAFSA